MRKTSQSGGIQRDKEISMVLHAKMDYEKYIRHARNSLDSWLCSDKESVERYFEAYEKHCACWDLIEEYGNIFPHIKIPPRDVIFEDEDVKNLSDLHLKLLTKDRYVGVELIRCNYLLEKSGHEDLIVKNDNVAGRYKKQKEPKKTIKQMKMINCPNCNHKINGVARKCPYCEFELLDELNDK